MKKTLYKDETFTLEATKDEYNNLRLTQIFKQGEHASIDEIILPAEQQQVLLEYLQNQLN